MNLYKYTYVQLPVVLLLYNLEALAPNTFYEHCSDNPYIEHPVKEENPITY